MSEPTNQSPASRDELWEARYHRTAFGVTAYRGLAARRLDLTVEIRCVAN